MCLGRIMSEDGLSLEAKMTMRFETDLQDVLLEFEIAHFVVRDLHFASHRVQEELKEQLFHLVACREELLPVDILIRNYDG